MILKNLFMLVFILGCNVAEQESISSSTQNQSNNTNNIKPNISFDLLASSKTEGDAVNLSLTRDSGDVPDQVVKIQIYQPVGNANSFDIINLFQGVDPLIITPGTFPDLNSYFEVTFDGNNLTANFDFTIFDDVNFESTESLVLRIVQNTNNDYNFFGITSHSILITDNDTTPTISLSDGAAATAQIAAEGSSINLHIELSAPASSDVNATLTWAGSASSSDHDFTQQTFVIPEGNLSTVVPINLNNDSFNELDENFVISFHSVSGANITATPNSSHTVTINDSTGALSDTEVNFITAPAVLNEDPGIAPNTLVVTAQFTGQLESSLNLPITFSGSAQLGIDYTVSSQNFQFAASSAPGVQSSVVITIINDLIYEGIETIQMDIASTPTSSIGVASSLTLTVQEDETSPTISFINTAYNTSEGATFNIPLKLDNAAFEDITVDYTLNTVPGDSATNPSDHLLALSGVFMIPAGQTVANIPIYIQNDTLYEGDEKIYISISNPLGAGASLGINTNLEVTIKEVGDLPVLSFVSSAQSVAEGSNAIVTLSLDQVSNVDQTFDIAFNNLTADPSDYTPPISTTYTILAGQLSLDITIAVHIDTIDEFTEDIQLSIIQPQSLQIGSTSSHTLHLIDTTSEPAIEFTTNSLTVDEGNSVTFNLQPTGSTTDYGLTIPYTISGTATYQEDYDMISSGTFNIPANTLPPYDFTINIPSDNVFEGSENLIITISDSQNYSLGATPSVTININDPPAFPNPTVETELLSYSANENDIIDFAVILDYALPNPLDVTIHVDDFYNSGLCGSGGCANIIQRNSIHSNGVNAGVSFNNGTTFSPMSQERVIQFGSAPPNTGSIGISGYSSSPIFSSAQVHTACGGGTCITTEQFAQSLSNLINASNDEVIVKEVYAYYQTNTDFITLIPRSPILDTDLNSILGAAVGLNSDELVVTIPAGTTRGTVSFQVIADNIYERSLIESFKMQITGTNHGSVLPGANSETEYFLTNLDPIPEASFDAITSLHIEGNGIANIPINLSNKSENEVSYKVQFFQNLTSLNNPADKNDFVLARKFASQKVTGMGNDSYQIPLEAASLYYYSPLFDSEDIYASNDITKISGSCSLENSNTLTLIINFGGAPDCELSINHPGGTLNTPAIGQADMYNYLTNLANTDLDKLREGYIVKDLSPLPVLTLEPYRAPPLSYTSDLIHEAQLTFRAETDIDYISLKITEDILFEGNEEIKVMISQIAPGEPTVASGHNEHALIISDNDSAPALGISSIPISGSTITEGNSPQSDPNLLDPNNDFNPIDYTIELSGINQHAAINFDVVFSGNGINFGGELSDINSRSDFIQGDLIVDFSNPSNPTFPVTNLLGDGVNIAIDKGYGLPLYKLSGRINKDLRYETDESLYTNINNSVGATGGSNLIHTIEDDDQPPFLKNTTADGGYLLNIYNEKEEIDLSSPFSLINSSDVTLTGADATQVPVTFDMDINLEARHSTAVTQFSSTVVLNESNNYFTNVELSPSQKGDIRSHKTINFISSNTSNATNWITPIAAAFDTNCNAANCTKTFSINTDDIKVFTNKVSWINTISFPNDGFVGSTCSLYRGQASCFGSNGYGLLGKENTNSTFGSNGEDLASQAQVINFGTDSQGKPLYVLDLALGQEHGCALIKLAPYNQVKCWGANTKGQLGIGTTGTAILGDEPGEMQALQTVNMGAFQKVKAIKALAFSTCAWFEDGNIKCWGENSRGELGIESTIDQSAPSSYVKGGSPFKMFKTGSQHSCGIREDNKFICWGYGGKGQLTSAFNNFGNIGITAGDMSHSSNFRDFHTSAANIVSIAIGHLHTCVTFDQTITNTYNSRCWGSNTYGQLGLGRASQIGSSNVTESHYNGLGSQSNVIHNMGNYINMGTQHALFEPYTPSGSYFDVSPLAAEGWFNIPHNSDNPNGGANHTINLGVTKNQFVQTRQPASSIGAGASYSCAVHNSDEQGVRDPFIRCWGSNFTDPNVTTTSFPSASDIGILNNVGFSKDFDGDSLIPYNSTPGPTELSEGNTCSNDSNYPLSPPYSDECQFSMRLAFIGDDANSASGNEFIDNYFGVSHEWGWLQNAAISPNIVNFELNYKYSEVDIDFNSQYPGGINNIEMASGDFHQCAIPKAADPASDNPGASSSNKFICWGSNGFGQSGVNNSPISTSPNCEYDKVGSFNSCGDSKNGKFFELDYTY